MTRSDVNVRNLLAFLEQVKKDRERIPYLADIANRPILVRQKLIASYGMERVKGGAIFSDPTLEALIKASKKAWFAKQQLDEIYDNMDYAKYLVSLVPSDHEWRCLYQFYIENWKLPQIALNLGCTSRSWAYELLKRAKKSVVKAYAEQ